MTSIVVLAIGASVVLCYDTAAALASRRFGFRYSRAQIGSYLLYAAIGYATVRNGTAVTPYTAGAVIGLVDVTAGWAVSWAIGPGRPPSGTLVPRQWLFIAAIMVMVAGICGMLGGALARSL